MHYARWSMLDDMVTSRSKEAARDWINIKAGPQPAGKMPERVAEVCAALARKISMTARSHTQ
jgi:hypothetical protein